MTNPFLYSDFRGMLHADYQEALENMDSTHNRNPSMSSKRPFTSSDGFQTGMGQNLKGRKKFSESVKEMFPMPEFNTYLSQPTKKKDRKKVRKPHTAAVNFRSGLSHTTKVPNHHNRFRRMLQATSQMCKAEWRTTSKLG